AGNSDGGRSDASDDDRARRAVQSHGGVLRIPPEPTWRRPRTAFARSCVRRHPGRLPARLDAVHRPRPVLLQRARAFFRDVERSALSIADRRRNSVGGGPLIARVTSRTTRGTRRENPARRALRVLRERQRFFWPLSRYSVIAARLVCDGSVE